MQIWTVKLEVPDEAKELSKVTQVIRLIAKLGLKYTINTKEVTEFTPPTFKAQVEGDNRG